MDEDAIQRARCDQVMADDSSPGVDENHDHRFDVRAEIRGVHDVRPPVSDGLIRQAEQLLRSANAQVGESVAEFLPKIGLTALLGKVSPELSGFTLGAANAWGVAAEATGPLFEGGRLVGQYHQSKAARSEFELRYRRTVLNAFREVSDALVSREQLVEMRQHQANEVTALETAVKLSTERYVAGKADYYEVLEAQQQLFPAQLNLARTQRDQFLAVVTL
jgi:multidrug efflux system outer membrane protein